MNDTYTIFLDFDGTVVTHEWPFMGIAVPFANDVITKLLTSRHKIIINTFRYDLSFQHVATLHNAIDYLISTFGYHDAFQYANMTYKIKPTGFIDEVNKTVFIDDITVNMPLVSVKSTPNDRTKFTDAVDWQYVESQLIAYNIL
jgi:hypothetical protein